MLPQIRPASSGSASYLLIVCVLGSMALEVADEPTSRQPAPEPDRLAARRRAFAALGRLIGVPEQHLMAVPLTGWLVVVIGMALGLGAVRRAVVGWRNGRVAISEQQ